MFWTNGKIKEEKPMPVQTAMELKSIPDEWFNQSEKERAMFVCVCVCLLANTISRKLFADFRPYISPAERDISLCQRERNAYLHSSFARIIHTVYSMDIKTMDLLIVKEKLSKSFLRVYGQHRIVEYESSRVIE